MTQDELVERCAREMCIDGGFDPDEIMPNDGPRWRYYVSSARAIIPIVQAATLDLVESHLSACAYDPAPYTALKYRLAAIRNQEPTDGR